MIQELATKGILLRDFAYCPHHPDLDGECPCRKPAPGMILDLARKYAVDLGASLVIGDKPSDIQAGERAGSRRTSWSRGACLM